jgi:multiple sugar transport system substrate-binding protein
MKLSVKKTVALIGAIAMAGSLAACGNSNSASSGSSSSSSVTKFDPNKKVTVNVWAWEPTLTPVVKAFEKKYPNVTVKLTNSGTNSAAYTALDNALKAGKGAPDIAQIEYYAVPQYAINHKLADLSAYGAEKYKSTFTTGTWNSVHWAGKLYALPQDSGPMAFFYNKEVFDKAGISEAPKTWDEFYEDAKKIRQAGSYITSDSGDAGFYDSMVWAFGGRPFKTSGTNVTVNLTGDAGAKKFTEYWQKMIDEGLIDTKTKGWTDDWNRALGDGSIAGLLTGAWMPANLVSGAGAAAGKWRVAKMPTLKEGEKANAENGGSSLAMLAGSKGAEAAAAYKFLEFATAGDGVDIRVKAGNFPASAKAMKESSFLDATTVSDSNGKPVEYFGGQKFNQVLAEAAQDVTSGYQFLPYEVYARGIYGDTAGAAFTGKTTLTKGIADWQAKIISYGKQQGFNVKQ